MKCVHKNSRLALNKTGPHMLEHVLAIPDLQRSQLDSCQGKTDAHKQVRSNHIGDLVNVFNVTNACSVLNSNC